MGYVSSHITGWTCLYLSIECGTNIHLIALHIELWMTPQVTADDKPHEELVLHGVYPSSVTMAPYHERGSCTHAHSAA